ncbi:MAG: FKBP-type peptidyl-prolyl cis-trans isomerase FklB [Oleiphilaceae bacterium]|jgi:FKBP-type peptidyl-prolyl cis-trans isomerase FklB
MAEMNTTSNKTDATQKPESFEKKVSYGFGWQFGRQLQKNRFEGMDVESAVQALRQCFAGEPSLLSENELNEAYDVMKEKRMTVEKERADKYKTICDTFLAENAKREGVLQTESGLQYEILEAGTGQMPNNKSTVRIHYHGSFIDGQVFDSSITRNEPAEFNLDQVISGWTEALQMMPEGSKWRIVVPPGLAYGDAGYPPAIPSGAVLIFEIHFMKLAW